MRSSGRSGYSLGVRHLAGGVLRYRYRQDRDPRPEAATPLPAFRPGGPIAGRIQMRESARVELTTIAASWSEHCRGLAWSIRDTKALRARTYRILQWGGRQDLVLAAERLKDADMATWLRLIVRHDREYERAILGAGIEIAPTDVVEAEDR